MPVYRLKKLSSLLFLGCLIFFSVGPAWADRVTVTIEGVNGAALKNVKKALSINDKPQKKRSVREIKRLHYLAKAEINKALQPYGYYHSRVQSQLEQIKNKPKWQAEYKIEPGPRVHIQSLQLALKGLGKHEPKLENIIQQAPLEQGQPLIQGDYEQLKNTLADTAYNLGYLDAGFEQSRIAINKRKNSAKVSLVFNTGRRFYFGDITLDQNFLNPKFAQKLVPIEQGEPFVTQRLINLQLLLSDTDYFSRIRIDPQRRNAKHRSTFEPWFEHLLWAKQSAPIKYIQPPNQIPVVVKADPSLPQSYKISAGYGTDTGFRVGFGVKFRHLNSMGHQFSINTRISEVESSLNARYDIPIKNVLTDRFSFVGSAAYKDFGDIRTRLINGGIVQDTSWQYGRQQLYLKAQYERYDLEDGYGNRHAHFLYPGWTGELRRLNRDFETRFGGLIHLDVRGTSDALGSNTSFIRTRLNSNLILPVTARSRLLLRGAVGALQTDDYSKVPPSQRFFSGGSGSVRGYGYQKLSPKKNGKRVGGRYLIEGSAEADYRFYKKFYIAAFYDVGNADMSFDMKLKRGTGLGLHWASPIGMIRLDFAHPLDDDDSNLRIHFNLGPVF